MKINRNNYELYFMDYLDGNLTDQDIRMLEDFILINPDLRTELEGTEKIVLSPEQIVYKQKDLLIKPDLNLPVNSVNFEDFCVASAEGDLNDLQNTGLKDYIKENPGSENLFLLFSQLHLFADNNITFRGKEKLKKSFHLIPRVILYPLLSVAAAVTFILIIYLRNENPSEHNINIASDLPVSVIDNPVAESKDESKVKSEIQKDKPDIQQASVFDLKYTKARKKSPAIKTRESLEKKNTENKKKELLPPQRLNQSFQIKLPSIAENRSNANSIDGDKIKFNSIKPSASSHEYLSLSEYARKELAEKILGNKKPLNSRLSAWQIADAGITGINKITGGEMKLQSRTGEDGTITAYSFNSKLLSFSTTAVK